MSLAGMYWCTSVLLRFQTPTPGRSTSGALSKEGLGRIIYGLKVLVVRSKHELQIRTANSSETRFGLGLVKPMYLCRLCPENPKIYGCWVF